jgi:L-fuconolactonase
VSAPDARSLRVDAHQHFWTLARGDYRWLTPALAPLYRDFGPKDLAPLLARAGVDATVLVQAADSVAETEHLLALARATDFVAGVVGWVDLERADAPDVLARLAREPKFVGVRPMLQDLDDPRWVLRPTVLSGLRAAAQLDLRFDALVKLPQLPALCELRQRLPELRIVVDHAAKPQLSQGATWSGWSAWRAHLTELASSRATYCKLSGLVTEASASWTLDSLRATFEFARATFGAERLLWGSDWPVIDLDADYLRWRAAADALTHGWNSRERDHVFGGSAVSFYGLTSPNQVAAGRTAPRRSTP